MTPAWRQGDNRMTTIKVRNWDKWQSWRSDRGAPPWIKVHRNLFTNPEWASLTDAEKGQLVSIWVVAADKSGEIPVDANLLRKICMLDNPPNLQRFVDLGFLEMPEGCQLDASLAPGRHPIDAPDKTRGEEIRDISKGILSGKGARPPVPYAEIIDFLNEKVGGKFKANTQSTKTKIKARWNEGFTLDDFKTVIERKADEWLTDSKMVQYLRPETLFGPKFEGYLQQAGKSTVNGSHTGDRCDKCANNRREKCRNLVKPPAIEGWTPAKCGAFVLCD